MNEPVSQSSCHFCQAAAVFHCAKTATRKVSTTHSTQLDAT